MHFRCVWVQFLVLAFLTCAYADQCGTGTRLPNHGAPCSTDSSCQMIKQVFKVTDPDKCCAICAAAAGATAWTLKLSKQICHCKAQNIQTVGYHTKDAVSGWFSSSPPGPPSPPMPSNAKNLLYIVVDDLRNELGFTNGRKGLVTPHIDALAKKGTVFSRAYVQQGVCSPSRNSFLSGRRPDTTKIWNFQQSFRDYLGNEASSWPGAFKNAGYLSIGQGKVYHPGHPAQDDGSLSWSLDWAAYYHPTGFSKQISSAPDNTFQDGMTTDKAITRLQRWANESDAAKASGQQQPPFFMGVGLHKPHIPWVMPQRFLDQQLPLEQTDTATHDVPPKNYCNASLYICDHVYKGLPWAPAPIDDQRDHRRKYRAAVSWTDFNVGRLLATLDELGLADTTAVVFHGDHGWHLGEHGGWCKQSNFDLVARVPLIVYVPWLTASHGTQSSALVEIVDLFPTTLDLFNITHRVHDANSLEGDSFLPLLLNPEMSHTDWKNATFTQYPRCKPANGEEPWLAPSDNACTAVSSSNFDAMGYSIRTDLYRYTLWLKWDGQQKAIAGWTGANVVGEELYDHTGDDGLDTDRFDNENLGCIGQYVSVCSRHKAALIAGWKQARPKMLLDHE